MKGFDLIIPVEKIAIICHQANQTYCASIDDPVPYNWGECTPEHRASVIDGVQGVIESFRMPDGHSREKSHNRWMERKLREGWRYGEKKDEVEKTHPCLLPYDSLPELQQVKDALFANIVRSFIQWN